MNNYLLYKISFKKNDIFLKIINFNYNFTLIQFHIQNRTKFLPSNLHIHINIIIIIYYFFNILLK